MGGHFVIGRCWTTDDVILCLLCSGVLWYGATQIICSREYLIFGMTAATLTGIYSTHLGG